VLAIMLFFGGWLFLSVRACVQLIYGRGNRRRDEASESPSPGPRVSRNVDVHVQAINSGGDDIEQEETSVVEEKVEFLSASPRNKPSSNKKPIERLTFRYRGPDGHEHTYHSLGEMPPPIRAIYERLASRTIDPEPDGPSGSKT
jgi:hypothetical protein